MQLLIPPPVQGVLTGVVMWLVARYAPFSEIDVSGRQLISAVLIGTGLMIELIAIGSFRRARTTVNPMAPERANQLVISGLYKYSRNPMYLGLALLLLGWGIYLGAIANIAVLALFIGAITYLQIKPEEEVLRAKFGEDYEAYCRRVRRWV